MRLPAGLLQAGTPMTARRARRPMDGQTGQPPPRSTRDSLRQPHLRQLLLRAEGAPSLPLTDGRLPFGFARLGFGLTGCGTILDPSLNGLGRLAAFRGRVVGGFG